jgi:hypothetical protein
MLSPPEPDPATTPPAAWAWFRIRRHVRWAREQGVARLIEEDDLDPLERIPAAVRKALWRLSNDASPLAVPVFVTGLQRSGTNMLVRGLERSPEFEVHNENDRAAFERFRLRPLPTIRSIVERSPHRFVLFKPLCDSHRLDELLDDLRTPSAGRALWIHRNVDDRVRSSVSKFGDSNLRALHAIADGFGDALWQAQGLSSDSLELIRSSVRDGLTPEAASALFWLVRNSILFERGWDRRPDVAVVSYDRMVEGPAATMATICSFLGIPTDDRFASHIAPRARRGARPIDLPTDLRRRCEELTDRLEAASVGAARARGPGEGPGKGPEEGEVPAAAG